MGEGGRMLWLVSNIKAGCHRAYLACGRVQEGAGGCGRVKWGIVEWQQCHGWSKDVVIGQQH